MPRIPALIVAASLFAVGCNEAAKPQATTDAEAKIQANLNKLPPEDRALAEEQIFCATEPENRLGGMGVPVKVLVKGEPVFLCCKGCEKNVQEKPDETLATVKRLKDKNAKKG
ncbi:MAG TPA: hypothetical protein VM597_41085 [Gemmataceae bacterium]|jgi:hypothetical protein|nr:hypothetical protein [Gemmataceae bacterium]